MPIKSYNPTSPGRRQGTVIDYKSIITKQTPEKVADLREAAVRPVAITTA
jgi:large subunit ribosomal protein L2